MGIYEWISLSLLCFFGAISPGPSLIIILNSAINYGKKASLFACIGHGLGIFIYAFSVTIILKNLYTEYENIILIIRILGSAFLIYLGIKLIIKKNNSNFTTKKNGENFINGFLISILNPKVIFFFLSVFGQFVNKENSILLNFKMALIAAFIDIFVYVSFVMIIFYVFKIENLLKFIYSINFVSGIFLIILGALLLMIKIY